MATKLNKASWARGNMKLSVVYMLTHIMINENLLRFSLYNLTAEHDECLPATRDLIKGNQLFPKKKQLNLWAMHIWNHLPTIWKVPLTIRSELKM